MKRFFIAIVVILLTFSGCGSSSHNKVIDVNQTNTNDNNKTINSNATIVEKTITGKVVDGELKDATVFIDSNKNGKLDANEPNGKSSDSGDYSLTIDNSILKSSNYLNSKLYIITQGGFDIRTEKEFIGTLKSNLNPDKSTANITPITTIIAQILISKEKENSSLDNKKEIDNIKLIISNVFDIDVSKLDNNPMEDLELLKVALKLQKSAEFLSKAKNINLEDAYIEMASLFITNSDKKFIDIMKNSEIGSEIENIVKIINSYTDISTLSRDIKNITPNSSNNSNNDNQSVPTSRPTTVPTSMPTITPTSAPTSTPTTAPTSAPTITPTPLPTSVPTPTIVPTPTPTSTNVPTPTPTSTTGGSSSGGGSGGSLPTPTPTPTLTPTLTPTPTPTPIPVDSDLNSSTPIEGVAVDGKLINSTVFLDLNRNDKWDTGEPKTTTNEIGKYSFTLTSAQKKASKTGYAPIIVMGGTDSGTAKKFRGRLRSPLSLRRPKVKVNVTPITTVLANSIEENITVDKPFTTDEDFDNIVKSAELKVSKVLNIDILKLEADPIAEAEKGDTTLIKLSLQIQKSIELATDLIDFTETGGEDGAFSFVYKSFSSTLLSYSSKTDLNTIFSAMVDSKLDSKIDKSKSKTLFKKQVSIMIESTSKFFVGSFNMQKLYIQFEQVISYISIGNFSFNIDSLINMSSADYTLIYNKQILSQYIDISTLSADQINAFFGGRLASITDLAKLININTFDDFISSITIPNGININNLKLKEISTEIKKYLEWSNGYCANVYIKNSGIIPKTWNIDMNISGKIFNSWNVNITDKNEFIDTNRTTFKASGTIWNKTVWPFSQTKFGYCAFNDIKNGKFTDANETSGKFNIVKGKKTSWEDGYCEEIRVENISNDVIDWKINDFNLSNSSYYGYYKAGRIKYDNSDSGKLKSIEDNNINGYLLPNRNFYFNYCASSNKDNPYIVDLYEDKVNSWSGKSTGVCNRVTIRNITPNPIKNWKLNDYGVVGYTFHTWDSNLTDSSEHKLSVEGISSNLNINGWGKARFGYCATNTELTVSNTITTVDKDSEYSYGNCKYITVINNNDNAVKWKYEINTTSPIDFISDAEMTDAGDNNYIVTGKDNSWNKILAPNEKTSFTYCKGTTQLTKVKIGNDTSYVRDDGYFGTITKPVIVANSFDEIDDKLSNFYDFSVEIRNSNLVKDATKDINVSIIINRFNPYYEDFIDVQLLAIVPLTITKKGNNVTITAKADSNLTLIARKSDDSFIYTKITNRDEDVKTTTTANGNKIFTIKASSILNRFTKASSHPRVSNYMKDVIFNNVTNVNSYDVYILFSNNAFDIDSPIILNKVNGGMDISYLMRIPENSELDKIILGLMGTDLRGYWGMIDLK